MTKKPLMPKATAIWLVDNTALSFEQIAEFCGLHPLEIQALADGELGQGIKGLDPLLTGQVSREELEACQKDPKRPLKMIPESSSVVKIKPRHKKPRYTPLSRRQDRPGAILWLLKRYPTLKDSQIEQLVGTTKGTITAIRERTHWNYANLAPLDPVILGLCTQTDLDREVAKLKKESGEVEADESDASDASVFSSLREKETRALEEKMRQSLESVFLSKTPESKQAAAPKEKETAPDLQSLFSDLSGKKKTKAGEGGGTS